MYLVYSMPKKTKKPENTIFEEAPAPAPEPVAEPTPEPVTENEPKNNCDIPPVPATEVKGEKLTKKKRVVSQETKDRLREQLKKGRETALKNRQKNAYVKKIDRQEELDKVEQKIIDDAVKKQKIKSADNSAELDALRKELAELKKAKNNPAPVVVEPVAEKVETPKKPKKVTINPKLDNHIIKEDNNKVVKKETTPPPPAKPVITNRELMRRMKGIL